MLFSGDLIFFTFFVFVDVADGGAAARTRPTNRNAKCQGLSNNIRFFSVFFFVAPFRFRMAFMRCSKQFHLLSKSQMNSIEIIHKAISSVANALQLSVTAFGIMRPKRAYISYAHCDMERCCILFRPLRSEYATVGRCPMCSSLSIDVVHRMRRDFSPAVNLRRPYFLFSVEMILL